MLSSKTSLYGRTVVTFVSSRGGPAGGFKLPANKMKAGDIVEVGTLSSSSSGTRLKRLASGVVTRMTAHAALVAFEEMPAPEQPFGKDAQACFFSSVFFLVGVLRLYRHYNVFFF